MRVCIGACNLCSRRSRWEFTFQLLRHHLLPPSLQAAAYFHDACFLSAPVKVHQPLPLSPLLQIYWAVFFIPFNPSINCRNSTDKDLSAVISMCSLTINMYVQTNITAGQIMSCRCHVAELTGETVVCFPRRCLCPALSEIRKNWHQHRYVLVKLSGMPMKPTLLIVMRLRVMLS